MHLTQAPQEGGNRGCSLAFLVPSTVNDYDSVYFLIPWVFILLLVLFFSVPVHAVHFESKNKPLSFFVDEFEGTRLGELIFFTGQGNSGAFCGDLGKARLLVNV